MEQVDASLVLSPVQNAQQQLQHVQTAQLTTPFPLTHAAALQGSSSTLQTATHASNALCHVLNALQLLQHAMLAQPTTPSQETLVIALHLDTL